VVLRGHARWATIGSMAHTPINHPLRPIYRTLAAIVGSYLIVFGVVGFIVTAGDGLVGSGGHRVLGQRANLLWSIIALVLGVAVLIGIVIGRNLDVRLDQYIGWGLVGIATYELAVNRTDANFLNFSIATVIVTYIVALVLIMAGLYSKVGTDEAAQAEQRAAHY
jgi:hypothetical protein